MMAGGRKRARRSEPIRSRILFAGAGEEVGTDIIAGPVGRIHGVGSQQREQALGG